MSVPHAVKVKAKRLYGLELEDHDALYELQNGVCAICLQPETSQYRGKTRALCVDHDHDSLIVRGLLCASCNKAIGLLMEDPQVIERAISYLEHGRV